MKSYSVQGATIFLLYLLIFANATPVPPNELTANLGAQVKSTGPSSYYYTQDGTHPLPMLEVINFNSHSLILFLISAVDPNTDVVDPCMEPQTIEHQHSYPVTDSQDQPFDFPAAKRLVDRMLCDKVETDKGPWHNEGPGEWSISVLRTMVRYMSARQDTHIKRNRGVHLAHAKAEWEASMSQSTVDTNWATREKLIRGMDLLWTWAEKTLMWNKKKAAVRRAQTKLKEIESGKLMVEDGGLISVLIASVPVEGSVEKSTMPWHSDNADDDVFRWKQNLKMGYVQKVLAFIWAKLRHHNVTLKEKHKVTDEEQEVLDGDFGTLLREMDKAWRRWLNYRAKKARENFVGGQKRREGKDKPEQQNSTA
ncbi:hypothetical protein H0H93_012233 [Arthromyces matolae]|nr:hypothetical protein H0H93_012233 [Arthromyces matolae]